MLVMRNAGSSPHTRGTQDAAGPARAVQRFIPAYAGNTGPGPPGYLGGPVHPRIRGEHCADGMYRDRFAGSSPHTRGTPVIPDVGPEILRFIPAYAGNTKWNCAPTLATAVHPRIRGEHTKTSWPTWNFGGSSPHTRGTRVSHKQGSGGTRFIPAYAGNTARESSCWRSMAVHPRIRGEHTVADDRLHAVAGSSPHTRGTRTAEHNIACARRFIPAYAGNTVLRMTIRSMGAVHPRIRGEHSYGTMKPDSCVGSSPHTRGTHSESVSCAPDPTVHPRIRGEHAAPMKRFSSRSGSSPHTRGTPLQASGAFVHPRFIPAYAGNTK